MYPGSYGLQCLLSVQTLLYRGFLVQILAKMTQKITKSGQNFEVFWRIQGGKLQYILCIMVEGMTGYAQILFHRNVKILSYIVQILSRSYQNLARISKFQISLAVISYSVIYMYRVVMGFKIRSTVGPGLPTRMEIVQESKSRIAGYLVSSREVYSGVFKLYMYYVHQSQLGYYVYS